ncbi:MAG TPA: SGNH/GDSL hydrolase family protein [Nocardioidaceae bacterium]|nr:SGNH/GDSL hydrolase family protein [Nocardioidaceae bacterium]
MSKASAARRLAAAAAYGGGGLGLLGGSFYGLLRAQAAWARRSIGPRQPDPPDSTGVYGLGLTGDVVDIALLGDSSACGYGMSEAVQTPGALLAAGLAEIAERPVRVGMHAAVGARSRDLEGQIEKALQTPPAVTVIIIGANDVTHSTRVQEAVRLLAEAVRRLRAAGSEVVVGTCPDLGTVRPIAPPLRQVARILSRQLAAAQTIAVVEAGGTTVSMGALLGPEFDREPGHYFGPDKFHPSAAGYQSVVAALLPSVAAALGLWPEAAEEPETFRGEGVLPVSYAAAEAAEEAGTEVSGTEVGGRQRGARGRWVTLRHRRRRPVPDVERMEHSEG